MDAKYLAEIKKDANWLVKLADNPYCQGPVSLLDGVKRVVPALLTEVERMNCELSRIRSNAADDKKMLQKDNAAKDQQIATLEKALELACEEISDYALPSGTGRMKSVLITARIEKFMNHAKRVQEQEERMIHHE